MASRDRRGAAVPGQGAAVHGLLAVDKPAGPTSFEVVQRVRRALGGVRAGHAGTLDPAATGLLAVCLGDGLKLQQFLVEGAKAYQATVTFGAATDTEDGEGRVIETGDASGLDAARIRAALPGLVGEILQVPPMYSAVRVGGRRLHEAARAGEAVERPPRRVRVDALELVALDAPEGGRVRARLAVRCGKGTYVRTLAADLGRALGLPAHLAGLRRTRSSGLAVEDAIGLEALEALAATDPAALRARVRSMADALSFMPAVGLDPGEARALAHGKAVPLAPESERSRRASAPPAPLVRALAPDGRLVAVCAPSGGALRPVRVLLTPQDLDPVAGGAGVDR